MGTKITALPQVVSPAGTDELAISQDTGLGGRTTYKATLDQVKNYVKNTGGGTGSVTSVGVNSTDESISVFGSPVVGAGTITLNISSVGLDKLKSGGATAGQVLTYNGSTSTWVASGLPASGIVPNTLTGNGTTTYALVSYTNEIASNYLVFVGGVAQRPTTDFTISGSSIIFGSTIATGVEILVYSVRNISAYNSIEKPASPMNGQVLTYNGSTSTWVASSLSAQGFTVSKSTNGYTYLPNGIIMQWGITGIIAAGSRVQETVTFPISFPNACFNVTSTLSGDLYGETDGLGTLRVQVVASNSLTNTSVVLEHTGLKPVRAYWQAIGY